MYVIKVMLMAAIGYLSGSVSYAILVARLVAGTDIRKMGNQNAGTMNVLRTIGKKWGVLVGILDGLKALVPMILARLVWFPDASPAHFLACLGVGLAALLGHWKPVFHGFRGGRGVGCIIGIYLFVVPVEFLISFLLSGLFVIFFLKSVRFRFGRWVPIIFILVTPLLVLALHFTVDIRLFERYTLGAYPWYTIVGVFVASLSMLAINLSFVGTRVDELRGEETTD